MLIDLVLNVFSIELGSGLPEASWINGLRVRFVKVRGLSPWYGAGGGMGRGK